jgi:hypothetical protein
VRDHDVAVSIAIHVAERTEARIWPDRHDRARRVDKGALPIPTFDLDTAWSASCLDTARRYEVNMSVSVNITQRK